MLNNNKDWQIFLLIGITLLMLSATMWSFNGHWAGTTANYNTYSLQAQAWLRGEVNVPNYSYLELATYKGQTFVSFPPFPSVVMFPFVLIFGNSTPDTFIGILFLTIGIFYAYKLARNFIDSKSTALFLALFVSIASNIIFIMHDAGWVWFFAQVLSFTFTMMALYYATTDKNYHFYFAYLFLAFAIGSRPFQIVYGVIILYFLLQRVKNIKQILLYLIPALLVGISYSIYNYIRFDNFLEFGHNYLPEMLNSSHGQFSFEYLIKNLKTLILLPEVGAKGIVNYPRFNGFSIFILNPIIIVMLMGFISYIVSSILNLKKEQNNKTFLLISTIFISIFLHIIFICMHITMGGWHFGNRYLIDILPAVFLLMILFDNYLKNYRIIYIPFFLYGLVFNTIGTTIFHLKP